jgi:hypothetical protein
MDQRQYQQPSTPPPSYSSVVNGNQFLNQVYSEQRAPEFDEFVNRYESEWFLS